MKQSLSVVMGSLLLLSSCMTEKKAVKQLEKIKVLYPELLSTRSDTLVRYREIVLNTPKIDSDTLVTTSLDSITITQKGVMTTIRRSDNTDGSHNYRIKTSIPALPLKAIVQDTFVKARTEVVTKVKAVIPVWIWLLVGGLVGAILYLLLRNIFNRLTQYLKLPF